MPHSYSIFLVNNKIKVQMGVSLASFLFLFLCVNWFTAPRVSAGGGGGFCFCFCFCAWRAGRGAGCCRTARRKQSRELFLRLEKRCPTTKRHKIPPPSAHSGGPAPLPRRPRRHAEPAARQAEPPAAPLGVPGVEGPARLLASARGWFGQRTNGGGKRSSAALLAGQRRGRRPPCGHGRLWPALFSIRPM